MDAQSFINSFIAAGKSIADSRAEKAEVIRKGILWIASAKNGALADLDAYCEKHSVKRFAMVKSLASVLMAENFHLADSGKGGAMKLSAMRNLGAEKGIDKDTSFASLPIPPIDVCNLIVSFKGKVKLETPSRVYTWEDTRKEIIAILEKRGFADKASAINAI